MPDAKKVRYQVTSIVFSAGQMRLLTFHEKKRDLLQFCVLLVAVS